MGPPIVPNPSSSSIILDGNNYKRDNFFRSQLTLTKNFKGNPITAVLRFLTAENKRNIDGSLPIELSKHSSQFDLILIIDLQVDLKELIEV